LTQAFSFFICRTHASKVAADDGILRGAIRDEDAESQVAKLPNGGTFLAQGSALTSSGRLGVNP